MAASRTPAAATSASSTRTAASASTSPARSTADGANIIQYTCGGGTNQQWQWQAATGSYFQLRARHSGKCLDVVSAGTGDGADIQQYTCGSGTNQQWTRTTT